MNSTSYKVALGGIISALCLLSMFMTGVIPVLSLVLPMVSGVLMMVVKEEISTGWAFLTYVSVSLLSLFVTFDKESSITFIFMFGLYPILKTFFDKIKPKILRWVCKLLYYDVFITIAFQIIFFIFGSQELMEDMTKYFGEHGMLILLLITNPVFGMYDYILGNFLVLYYKYLKPKISRN